MNTLIIIFFSLIGLCVWIIIIGMYNTDDFDSHDTDDFDSHVTDGLDSHKTLKGDISFDKEEGIYTISKQIINGKNNSWKEIGKNAVKKTKMLTIKS